MTDLTTARLRYPVGDHVAGTVTAIPRPGAIGLFVDLGAPPLGFVDVLHLPHSADQWPPVGTTTDFEVLQHRPGQVRLWPLNDTFRSPTTPWPTDKTAWQTTKHRHPTGTKITATITEVFPANHEYVVTFADGSAVLPWTDHPPTIGTTATFTVARHLDTTRRLLPRPL